MTRGDVCLVNFGQAEGKEQGGKRPALVVSADLYHQGTAELVIVVPITSRQTGVPSDIRLDPPEGGLDRVSFIRCDHVRNVSTNRVYKRLGQVSPETMHQVEEWLQVLLAL